MQGALKGSSAPDCAPETQKSSSGEVHAGGTSGSDVNSSLSAGVVHYRLHTVIGGQSQTPVQGLFRQVPCVRDTHDWPGVGAPLRLDPSLPADILKCSKAPRSSPCCYRGCARPLSKGQRYLLREEFGRARPSGSSFRKVPQTAQLTHCRSFPAPCSARYNSADQES